MSSWSIARIAGRLALVLACCLAGCAGSIQEVRCGHGYYMECARHLQAVQRRPGEVDRGDELAAAETLLESLEKIRRAPEATFRRGMLLLYGRYTLTPTSATGRVVVSSPVDVVSNTT